MTITIQLTEAEAARIAYLLEADAHASNRKVWAEKTNGDLSAASGRRQAIYEANRDEALAIIRKIDVVL